MKQIYYTIAGRIFLPRRCKNYVIIIITLE